MDAAYAATSGGLGGTLVNLLPIIIIFVIFYFFLILPQQRRQKSHKEQLKNVQVGDEVITSSGIIGRIVSIQSVNFVVVEISKGVNVVMRKTAIANVGPNLTTDQVRAQQTSSNQTKKGGFLSSLLGGGKKSTEPEKTKQIPEKSQDKAQKPKTETKQQSRGSKTIRIKRKTDSKSTRSKNNQKRS